MKQENDKIVAEAIRQDLPYSHMRNLGGKIRKQTYFRLRKIYSEGMAPKNLTTTDLRGKKRLRPFFFRVGKKTEKAKILGVLPRGRHREVYYGAGIQFLVRVSEVYFLFGRKILFSRGEKRKNSAIIRTKRIFRKIRENLKMESYDVLSIEEIHLYSK